LAAAAALPAFASCNQTVGECWPVGQGDGSEGTGAGVVGSSGAGAGASGEVPPEQPQNATSAPDPCNAPADDADPLGLKVFCKTPDHGAVCSERCFAKGVPCVPLAVHPKKSDGGIGKLFSCNDLVVGFMCGYHYDGNGDDCYFPFGSPLPQLCAYSGNN
jgi:hypothetical protein